MQRVFRAKRTNLHEKYDYPVLGAWALALEIFAAWLARRGAGSTTVWMFRRAGEVLLALDLCAMVVIASAHTAHLVRSCWSLM